LIATLETSMPDPAPNAELLRSLGRLVRGLSALFWGLPLTLIVCVETAESSNLRSFNVLPPVLTTGLLVYGLWQLSYFQRQERIWIKALDWAIMLGLVDMGLSPFLFWWNQRPDQEFYVVMVGLLAVSGIIFLSSLNLVLYRLSAMLPDENLRLETRHFTTLNRFVLLGILLLGSMFILWPRFPALPMLPLSLDRLAVVGGPWLIVFLALVPLALTMALVWKIKQVILDSVFGAGR
jgi:hypothetical protein